MRIRNTDNTIFNGKSYITRRTNIRRQTAQLKHILNNLQEENSYRSELLRSRQQQQQNKGLLSEFFEGIVKLFT